MACPARAGRRPFASLRPRARLLRRFRACHALRVHRWSAAAAAGPKGGCCQVVLPLPRGVLQATTARVHSGCRDPPAALRWGTAGPRRGWLAGVRRSAASRQLCEETKFDASVGPERLSGPWDVLPQSDGALSRDAALYFCCAGARGSASGDEVAPVFRTFVPRIAVEQTALLPLHPPANRTAIS